MNSFTLNRCWFVFFIAAAAVGAGCSKEAKKIRHLERATKSFAAGKYEVAEVEYLNVLRFEPTNRLAIRNLGVIASDQGRLAQAFTLLGQAKKTNPDDFEVRLKLAQSYLAGGGVDQARDETLSLLDRFLNSDVLLLLVESSATSNHLVDAEERLNLLKSKAAEMAGFHLALGTIELRKGDFSNAEKSFQKALALDPKSSAVHVAIGNLHAFKNERPQAEVAYKRRWNSLLHDLLIFLPT